MIGGVVVFIIGGLLSIWLSVYYIREYGDADYQRRMRENIGNETTCMLVTCFFFWPLCIPGHIIAIAVNKVQEIV